MLSCWRVSALQQDTPSSSHLFNQKSFDQINKTTLHCYNVQGRFRINCWNQCVLKSRSKITWVILADCVKIISQFADDSDLIWQPVILIYLKWENSSTIEVLGIFLSLDRTIAYFQNYHRRLDAIFGFVHYWKSRHFLFMGKVLLLKSHIFSCLIY